MKAASSTTEIYFRREFLTDGKVSSPRISMMQAAGWLRAEGVGRDIRIALSEVGGGVGTDQEGHCNCQSKH